MGSIADDEERRHQREAMGRRIRDMREGKGIGQPQLAALAEISQPSLSAIENGKTVEITARTLISLCRALGTTLEYVWEGGEGAESQQHEAELVALYRSLPQAARFALLQSARTMKVAMESRAHADESTGAVARDDAAISARLMASTKRGMPQQKVRKLR